MAVTVLLQGLIPGFVPACEIGKDLFDKALITICPSAAQVLKLLAGILTIVVPFLVQVASLFVLLSGTLSSPRSVKYSPALSASAFKSMLKRTFELTALAVTFVKVNILSLAK